jgi:hypothetical protein
VRWLFLGNGIPVYIPLALHYIFSINAPIRAIGGVIFEKTPIEMDKRLRTLAAIILAVMTACGTENSQTPFQVETTHPRKTSFESVDPETSGIQFTNILTESEKMNHGIYKYLYMGGGVSVGDINNDGLPDIYFTGNQVSNRLYLNKGGMKFEDVTDQARVGGDDRWMTGTTMADVNNDGLLDIYVSVSGLENTANLLYINNGDTTFTESSSNYMLDHKGPTVQTYFFDFDRDGDLDAYIGNYPSTSFSVPNSYYVDKMDNPSYLESDRLMRNDGGVFTDVSEEAGILNFGLTLSAAISDFNADGWPDVYVSNDLNSPDYLYINQGNGSFKNQLADRLPHVSNFGMGCDAADMNNDGFIDIMQLDMLAEDNYQQKTNMPSMNPDRFNEMVRVGLHYQYMKNCLQVNDGNGNFMDVGYMAGVSASDWSWGSLMADMDNDGLKDIIVSNGMRYSVNDKDFNKELKKSLSSKSGKEINYEMYKDVWRNAPVVKAANYAFKNNGNLTYENTSADWNLDVKGFSTGMAYADLDRDGDLDVVLNNLDSLSSVLENKGNENNYLGVILKGSESNSSGLGATITIDQAGIKQTTQIYTSRGFQSSVEPAVFFALKRDLPVDKLEVVWPNGRVQVVQPDKLNAYISVTEDLSASVAGISSVDKSVFARVNLPEGLRHIENNFDDFKGQQVLLPHKMSTWGPSFCKGDVNGDGLEDVFVGGAKGNRAAFFVQTSNGGFAPVSGQVFGEHARYEDVGALLLDGDSDGDLDLYVASGGNEAVKGHPYYQHRYYLNNGFGDFTYAPELIPDIRVSGKAVEAFDYDSDGDLDLFVGGRHVPGNYPQPTSSYLLKNDGGVFTDVTESIFVDLQNIGMVTSAAFLDIQNDGMPELAVTGEWMDIRIFSFDGEKFGEIDQAFEDEAQTGWWFSLKKADVDNDGNMDLLAGNLGLNYKYQASKNSPFEVYSKDFDDNGGSDIVLGYSDGKSSYPVRGLQCSSQQIPDLKKKFPSYHEFGLASLQDVYGKEELGEALHHKITDFSSVFFRNKGDGSFEKIPLPMEAQVSPIMDFEFDDFDQDGIKEVLLAGNLFTAEVETPRADAGKGLMLKWDAIKKMLIPLRHTGFMAKNDVRHLGVVKTLKGKKIFIINNNGPLELFVSK